MRHYIRLDPNLPDHKQEGYPDGPGMAFFLTMCFAEQQPKRGRFRNQKILAALLGRRARWIPFLVGSGDLIRGESGELYFDGWDEWQEGDWKVAERMKRVRERQRQASDDERSPGAIRTAAWRRRNQVFERDGYTCRYCGDTEYERQWLVLEHVVPDGPSVPENLVTACRPCNKKKGSRTPEAAGMTLRDVSPRDASHPTRDVSPPSERQAVSGKREAVSASQVVRYPNPEDDPVIQLAQWWHGFIGRMISEHDKQAAAAFVVDYPRLGLAGIQARIIEYATWRVENNKQALGKLEFYRDTLREQESHLADDGILRPREHTNGQMTRAFEAVS